MIGGLLFISFGVWFTAWIDGRDSMEGPGNPYDPGSVMTSVYGVPGKTAPAVVVPPPDAPAATAAIVELYQRVFTPGPSAELWDPLITDPEGLREQIQPFGESDCAVGVETIVTKVQFTGDDTADVQLRFQGPNIPEFGAGYLFDGGAERQPDGSRKATPEAVWQVVNLAGAYCT